MNEEVITCIDTRNIKGEKIVQIPLDKNKE